MIYRAPDGTTFSRYTAFCDHMSYLARLAGDEKTAEYYQQEKKKMIEKQERGFPIFAIFIIAGMLFLLISTCN